MDIFWAPATVGGALCEVSTAQFCTSFIQPINSEMSQTQRLQTYHPLRNSHFSGGKMDNFSAVNSMSSDLCPFLGLGQNSGDPAIGNDLGKDLQGGHPGGDESCAISMQKEDREDGFGWGGGAVFRRENSTHRSSKVWNTLTSSENP